MKKGLVGQQQGDWNTNAFIKVICGGEAAKLCLYYDSPEVEVIAFPVDTYYLKKGTKGSRLSTGSWNFAIDTSITLKKQEGK